MVSYGNQITRSISIAKEEGIQDAAWFDPREIPTLNMPMFNNIRDVLIRYNLEKLTPGKTDK